MKGLPHKEIIDGMTVYRLRFFPGKVPGVYHLPTGVYPLGAGRVIKEFRPDIIHFTVFDWFLPNLFIYWKTCGKEIAHLYTIFYHEFENFASLKPFIWVNSYLGRSVDAVHVVSKTAKRNVASKFKTPLDRIKVIPLGVDNHHQSGGSKNGNSSGLTILSVGRLSPRKGQLQLLSIYKELVGEISPSPRLVLAGGDGGHRGEILRYIEENGLGESVLVPSHTPDEELERLYSNSDIFVMLSEDESFGLVYTEAMIKGLPVVTYKVGAVPELLKEGAILLNRSDTQGVKNALKILLTDHDMRRGLSEKARRYVERNFSWQRTAAELLELYQHILSRKQEAFATTM
jgi:glycosyltransferase involved in cell wall biosynthesis